MSRCNNWPSALANFIAEKQHAPFVWGVNDCCMFAADWVKRLTNSDPAVAFIGAYDSALSAQRILQAHNGVREIVDQQYLRHPNALYARRGDVVSFLTEDGEALGVCDGATCVFAGPTGIIRKQTGDCAVAWRVD